MENEAFVESLQQLLDTNPWDYNPTPAHPAKWWRTIDGVAIVHGLRVWDYDLKVREVNVKETHYADPNNEFHEHWGGWFEMRDPETGKRGSTMNGERMWVRHPTTGVTA